MSRWTVLVIIAMTSSATADVVRESWFVNGKQADKIDASYQKKHNKAAIVLRCAEYEWDGKKLVKKK